MDSEFPRSMERIVELSHLLTVTNSSANLYIYLLKHRLTSLLPSLTGQPLNKDTPLTTITTLSLVQSVSMRPSQESENSFKTVLVILSLCK